MPNRLANETSPYLLQHRDNPVDWYPWGPEALERARAEERPILLSVGYSACHWCHVMEHESFEDPQTAALMNELFVNVKVDREERPDIDSIYMAAVQQMTGRGGWPMTVFLTPDGAPFYGGTYYPPEPRYGMPSFRQVLAGVADAWKERRGDVDQSAAELTEAVRQGTDMRPPPGALDPVPAGPGVRGAPAPLRLRVGRAGGGAQVPAAADASTSCCARGSARGTPTRCAGWRSTLRRMASGGIYDHLGGGFARYSVDAHWLVPHFEKMLYDNALLVPLYLNAWQATGADEYRGVAEDVLQLGDAGDDVAGGRLLLRAGRGQRGGGGALLRLDARADRRGAGPGGGRHRPRVLRRDGGGELRGAQHPARLAHGGGGRGRRRGRRRSG